MLMNRLSLGRRAAALLRLLLLLMLRLAHDYDVQGVMPRAHLPDLT